MLNETQTEWIRNALTGCSSEYVKLLCRTICAGRSGEIKLLLPALDAAMEENQQFLPEWLKREIVRSKAQELGVSVA